MSDVKPLGVFGGNRGFGRSNAALVRYLRDTAGAIPEGPDRVLLGRYLRWSQLIAAWMEATDDIVGGEFTVMGGSGTNSDGRYFWRRDTANYVEKYGVALPADFVEYALEVGEPPQLDPVQVKEIDDALMSHLYREAKALMRELIGE